jgi:hypothetical protein
MVWKILNPALGMPAIGEVVDQADGYVEPVPYGLIVQAFDETYGAGEFIFLKGVASTAQYNAVVYNEDDYSTTRTVADLIGPVAIAMGAIVASKCGWYQIGGKGVVTAGTVTDNGNVYVTATPGSLDDAVVAGDRVKRAKFASANGTPSTGLAEIEIQRPFVDDGTAA